MDFKELLPIGSVVILHNATKRLMIYGVGQTNLDDGCDYDYIGVMYPEGLVGDDSRFLFNHSDIKDVIFRGYEDDERNLFLEYLNEYYNNNN